VTLEIAPGFFLLKRGGSMKKRSVVKKSFFAVIAALSIIASFVVVNALEPTVSEDPRVRMPGTQPDQGVKPIGRTGP
jgi:hypothetical protein